MPYSKELNLIFVAVPKTGTTSMTRALGSLCSDLILRAKPKKHYSIMNIRERISEDDFKRSLKFSVVRNSWSYMLSRYLFTHVDQEPSEKEKLRRKTQRTFHDLSLEDWVEERWKDKECHWKYRQLRYLVDENGLAIMDHIGRLDNVQATLDWVTDELKVDRMEMPYVNGTRPGHYAQYYDENTMQMVQEICKDDIEYFNFEFQPSA